jgi:hypothetical protein
MEPASKILKRSHPVLPLDLIRNIVEMAVEGQLYKLYCREGHRMWLEFGGQLVLEDFRNYNEKGAYRTPLDILSRQLAMYEQNEDEKVIYHFEHDIMSYVKQEWVDHFDHLISQIDYESYETVIFIMGDGEDV